MDAVNVTPNRLLYEHFRVLNFRGWRSILENHKHFVPQKFGTIWHLSLLSALFLSLSAYS